MQSPWSQSTTCPPDDPFAPVPGIITRLIATGRTITTLIVRARQAAPVPTAPEESVTAWLRLAGPPDSSGPSRQVVEALVAHWTLDITAPAQRAGTRPPAVPSSRAPAMGSGATHRPR